MGVRVAAGRTAPAGEISGALNESVPSYENDEQVCITDDDENYFPGYLEVLPDVPITEQRKKDHSSSNSIDQYENVSESQRHLLGDYVNVLQPEALLPDFSLVGISDRESEDDVPDYENVYPGL